MAYDPDSPAQDHAGLTDIDKIRENSNQLRKFEAGEGAPGSTVAGMLWLYTPASGNWVLRQRNKDNNGWIDLWEVTTSGVPKAHIDSLITPSNAVHGIQQGTGNGLDADKLDGKHYDEIEITMSMLKTATGSASGSIPTESAVNITMQDYCFFPNIKTSGGEYGYTLILGVPTANDDHVGRFRIENTWLWNSVSYTVKWRYVTASDEPFIFVEFDENGVIKHVWECDDPPPGYWGLKEIPEGFIPPVIEEFTPNPKKPGETGEAAEAAKGEVKPKADGEAKGRTLTIFKYNKESLKELRQTACKDKKSMCDLLQGYDFDEKKKLFIPKNLRQI